LLARSGAAARRLPREPTSHRRADTGTLPPRPRIFVNRTGTLSDLSSRLADPYPVVLQLTGRSGIGRTTLVRQFLGDPSVTKLDGAIFFGASDGPNDMLQEMFETTYETDKPFAPMGASRAKLLSVPKLLVVVDDFDGDALTVDRLTSNAQNCSFIFVTDSARLEGMDDTIRLADLEPADAAKLFAAAQAASSRTFSVPSQPDFHGASPLDIVRMAGVTDQSEEIDGATAQRIMLASLSAPDRLVLAPFVVTKGGPLDAAVAGELAGLPSPTPILESLEARGLMDFDGSRYRLRSELIDLVQVPITSQRIINALNVFDEKLAGTLTVRELAAFAAAANNALEAAVKDQRYEAAIETGRTLAGALILAARFDRARDTLELVLDAARKLRDREIEAWALHQIGTVAYVTGDEAAQTSLSRALELRERMDDRPGAAVTRQNLALLLGVTTPLPASAEENNPRIRLGPVLLGVAAGIAALVGAALFLFRPFATPAPRAPAHAHHLKMHAKPLASAPQAVAPNQGPVLNSDAQTPAPVREAPEEKATAKSVSVLPPAKPSPSAKAAHKAAAPRHVIAPVGIDSFAASPATIAVGEYAQLCFEIRNANSAHIEGLGPVVARGAHCLTIHPAHTATYTLVANSGPQSTRAYTTLSVTATAAKPEAIEP
jgi:tetratricopeptide (TPR) repeat protein